MRNVKNVIEEYDSSNEKDHKKIRIIQWFQRHPGRRFDRTEVHQELGDELGVGQKSIGNYLEELESEDVLQSYGNQRISYRLADDIIVPVKHQIRAGWNHLSEIFNISRWGFAGFLVITTTIWAVLTLPFWFFSVVLFLVPRTDIGPIHQSEIFMVTGSMTIWIVLFTGLSYLLFRTRQWWLSRTV